MHVSCLVYILMDTVWQQAMNDKKRILFERKLKDEPIAYDVLNKPIVEGDFILYACQNGHRAELRVAKIIESVENKNKYSTERAKVKIRRCEKRGGWTRASRDWELMAKPSYFTRLDNSYLLENPPQEILDLFDED